MFNTRHHARVLNTCSPNAVKSCVDAVNGPLAHTYTQTYTHKSCVLDRRYERIDVCTSQSFLVLALAGPRGAARRTAAAP